MEKDNFFTPARFEQKLFYPRKCVTCDKSEFTTKQRKMCLTTSMGKIRLQHIYRSNNYVIINKKSFFDSNILKFTKLKPLSITPKSANLRHNSLLQQNSIKFGTHFTRARKIFSLALLARWNVFPSLVRHRKLSCQH